MHKRWMLFLIFTALLIFPASALAQDYYFNLTQFDVHAFWNEDGTLSVDYTYYFQNDSGGHPIEYVDVPMPNSNFDEKSVFADVNGNPVTDISRSGYQGDGVGVAVGLGQYSIPPGQSGAVHVFVGTIERKLEYDPGDDDYVAAVFGPANFDSRIVYGSTDMTVTFHLPPGIEPEQPRWHQAPAGWPSEPETGYDENDRVTYTWRNPNARADRSYVFGASFPQQFVPESAVVRPNPLAGLVNIDFSCLIPFACFGFFALIVVVGLLSEKQRKLKYLPPKIAIEGHGIKRGLTAVEAAILLEQPVDKVLTMILFSVIKKNAAEVVTRDPLKLSVSSSLPEDLRPYETDFLEAFRLNDNKKRQAALEAMMVSLVKEVSQKMKGFSLRETVAYYKDIMTRAWSQVEAAETPEVKSQKFDEVMEWTMLDKDFNGRTRDVFRTGPVFVPQWWGRYDPGYGRTGHTSVPTSAPSTGKSSGGSLSLPNLPGGDFAASMVGGIQSFSSNVVGNISDFTGRITQKTNPPPPPPKTTSYRGGGGGGGGRSCACACACAGCACACAGGGR